MLKNKEKGSASARRRRDGFTLIELLVVVAIIGILASVILVSLGSARAKARDARRISDVKQLQNALELYFSTYGRYPSAAEFAKGTDTGSTHYIAPAFMPNLPTDPLSGANYKYAGRKIPSQASADTKCLTYHIGASLEEATADTPVMKTDSDFNADGSEDACSGGAAFNGASQTANCDGTATLAEACYDLTP